MRVLVFVFVCLLVIAGLGAFYVAAPYGPAGETFVDIEPGLGTAGIAKKLEDAGVVRSQYAFEGYKEWKSGSLKAGEYRFDHAVPMNEVYERLRKGDMYTKTVLIPEGFNIFDIAQAVGETELVSSTEFLAAEKQDTELIARWSPSATTLEGFLFPDTYKFSRHTTAVMMLSAMVKRFGQQARVLGLRDEDVPRVVTMASLVEKEVHVNAERPTVAGVFENRLAAGMPLQTDPTVIYASQLNGTWTGVIHESELHSESPYNTYKSVGLPPGPICSPGMAALKAAMKPVKTDYLYFVANADGSTKFARTLGEHNGNVAVYRKAGSRK